MSIKNHNILRFWLKRLVSSDNKPFEGEVAVAVIQLVRRNTWNRIHSDLVLRLAACLLGSSNGRATLLIPIFTRSCPFAGRVLRSEFRCKRASFEPIWAFTLFRALPKLGKGFQGLPFWPNGCFQTRIAEKARSESRLMNRPTG